MVVCSRRPFIVTPFSHNITRRRNKRSTCLFIAVSFPLLRYFRTFPSARSLARLLTDLLVCRLPLLLQEIFHNFTTTGVSDEHLGNTLLQAFCHIVLILASLEIGNNDEVSMACTAYATPTRTTDRQRLLADHHSPCPCWKLQLLLLREIGHVFESTSPRSYRRMPSAPKRDMAM